MLSLLSCLPSRLFVRNPYRMLKRLSHTRLRLRTAIHVGAHLAQERALYEQMGLSRIVWVEGSPSIYTELKSSLELGMAEGELSSEHVPVNALLSDKPGQQLTLFGFDNGGNSNSIFQPTQTFHRRYPGVKPTGSGETVATSCLDDIAAATVTGDVDLLTLDVQGAELRVLRGGKETLRQAKAVICEVSKIPIYDGGVLYRDIKQHIEDNGFLQMHASHTCGDVLFLRRELI